MTHLTIQYPSAVLGFTVTVHVLMPSETGLSRREDSSPFPNQARCLLFLHGMQNTPEDVLLGTRIGHLADLHQTAVLLPEGGNSFWMDTEDGPLWETFLAKELLPAMRALLPLSAQREDTFVGGYSMGGYGSVRQALLFPEVYSRCICLSGSLDITKSSPIARAISSRSLPGILQRRKELSGTRYDLMELLSDFPKDAPKPSLYFGCGTQDFFLQQSQDFALKASGLGFCALCRFEEGGHDFDYWDPALFHALDWLSASSS